MISAKTVLSKHKTGMVRRSERALPLLRWFNTPHVPVHAVVMRTIILTALLLGIAPSVAQEAPSFWRDPDGGCTYFKLGNNLSLRYQRDGLPDCPDVRRETRPSFIPPSEQDAAVTRDDVREVTRAIEGLNRRMDDVKREFERRGRY